MSVIIARELLRIADGLVAEAMTESKIEKMIDEYGEDAVKDAVKKIVTARKRMANPALRHLQREMGKKKPSKQPVSDDIKFQETDEEARARSESKAKALAETKSLPLVKRLVKQLQIHVSEQPGYVFKPGGSTEKTPSRAKFDANPKEWSKGRSNGGSGGDSGNSEKRWTRKEWDAYKKKHPGTKIKPKFRD